MVINVGALIVASTVLGVLYYNSTIMGPQTLFPIIKAPILGTRRELRQAGTTCHANRGGVHEPFHRARGVSRLSNRQPSQGFTLNASETSTQNL